MYFLYMYNRYMYLRHIMKLVLYATGTSLRTCICMFLSVSCVHYYEYIQYASCIVQDGLSPLTVAIEMGHSEIVDILLNSGAGLN